MAWKEKDHVEIGVPYECVICGTVYIDVVAAPWIEDPHIPDPKCLKHLQQAVRCGLPPTLSSTPDDSEFPVCALRMLPCPSCSEARFALPFSAISLTSVEDTETALFWARPMMNDSETVPLYYRQSQNEWRLMSGGPGGDSSPKLLHLDPRSTSGIKVQAETTFKSTSWSPKQDYRQFFVPVEIHQSKLADLNVQGDPHQWKTGKRRQSSWSRGFFLGGKDGSEHAVAFHLALKEAEISFETACELHAILARIAANEFILEDYTPDQARERTMNSSSLVSVCELLEDGSISVPLLGQKPKDLELDKLKEVFHLIQRRLLETQPQQPSKAPSSTEKFPLSDRPEDQL